MTIHVEITSLASHADGVSVTALIRFDACEPIPQARTSIGIPQSMMTMPMTHEGSVARWLGKTGSAERWANGFGGSASKLGKWARWLGEPQERARVALGKKWHSIMCHSPGTFARLEIN